jgi:hypothetical protein
LNKSDGTFIQLEDLKAVGAVPTDFKSGPGEKPKKYPDKKVYCLFRIKKSDGSEWLVSRQKWVGLDRLGNETMKVFLDPETYDKPNFSYQNVRIVDNKNKTNIVNDPFPKFEIKAATVSYTKEPTLPFTLKSLEQLYAMRDPEGIELVIKDKRINAAPRGGLTYEQFKRPFDELWDWANTPKFNLDRSVKDNL